MTREEAVKKLVTEGRLSVAHAEDLYDSIIPKPVVPQVVADWYEEIKEGKNKPILEYLVNWNEIPYNDFKRWMSLTCDTQVITTLVNMYQFGYEVEKETKYQVRIKQTNQYLCNDDGNLHFSPGFRMDFTKTDLEKLDLGWVFNCEGIEVKEVKY
ncbi:DUF1642 domain-containing protein [Streptococcus thermophilus]|uniref:DUF1642 domain-containing protein n=1 Tax=Streptococcus thermophilus TaxID=1308 RepID=UPI002181FAC2|nr:DUF1642 domain-containing protein [Streptococcus thermophilus]MCS8613775.1 DUF1642 domain-containing protein [Streptococcus thermophilus]